MSKFSIVKTSKFSVNEVSEVSLNQLWKSASLVARVVEVKDNGGVKLVFESPTIFGDREMWLYADDLFYKWEYLGVAAVEVNWFGDKFYGFKVVKAGA